MAKTKYIPAAEVAEIAKGLIEKYHHHLIDFNVRIEYAFVNKTPKKGGKEVWAYVRKISSLPAYLAGSDVHEQAGDFFVMVVSEPVWDVLPQDKRIPLVDHELCHLWAEADQEDEDDADDIPEEPVKLSLNSHDVEEHTAIVRRYGFWMDGLEDFVNAAIQAKKVEDDTETQEDEEEIS